MWLQGLESLERGAIIAEGEQPEPRSWRSTVQLLLDVVANGVQVRSLRWWSVLGNASKRVVATRTQSAGSEPRLQDEDPLQDPGSRRAHLAEGDAVDVKGENWGFSGRGASSFDALLSWEEGVGSEPCTPSEGERAHLAE